MAQKLWDFWRRNCGTGRKNYGILHQDRIPRMWGKRIHGERSRFSLCHIPVEPTVPGTHDTAPSWIKQSLRYGHSSVVR